MIATYVIKSSRSISSNRDTNTTCCSSIKSWCVGCVICNLITVKTIYNTCFISTTSTVSSCIFTKVKCVSRITNIILIKLICCSTYKCKSWCFSICSKLTTSKVVSFSRSLIIVRMRYRLISNCNCICNKIRYCNCCSNLEYSSLTLVNSNISRCFSDCYKVLNNSSTTWCRNEVRIVNIKTTI